MRFTRRRSRRPTVEIGGRQVPIVPGAGVAVYEIEGRIILRVVDGSSGAGLERSEQQTLDGFPDIDPESLGDALVALAAEADFVEPPTVWPKLSEYARPLLDASPTRHRSYRSWQRRARRVSVTVRIDGVHATRWRADLGRGAWLPDEQAAHIADPTNRHIGAAVLELLAAPPIAG